MKTNTQRTMEAGLVGWRQRFAHRVERPISKRTPLEGRQIRAILGALFFAKSALYVARALRKAVKNR